MVNILIEMIRLYDKKSIKKSLRNYCGVKRTEVDKYNGYILKESIKEWYGSVWGVTKDITYQNKLPEDVKSCLDSVLGEIKPSNIDLLAKKLADKEFDGCDDDEKFRLSLIKSVILDEALEKFCREQIVVAYLRNDAVFPYSHSKTA